MSESGRYAEDLAKPSYKWIGERFSVATRTGGRISMCPGGLGFSFFDCPGKRSLRITLRVLREDGATESYLLETHYIGEWGGGWQKWQTDRLPLFPYESLHGAVTGISFSYSVVTDGAPLPSRYQYRFATLGDFYEGRLSPDDFDDPLFRRDNDEIVGAALRQDRLQEAYERLNYPERQGSVVPFFTRGDPGGPGHPVREIHRAIDRVIGRKGRDPRGRPTIRLAVFDIDNEDISRHLVYAAEQGVEIEGVADWLQLSPLNPSENIARLRRAGIPLYGVVRNDPTRPDQDMNSMHTKFILFDDDMVHSGSYNLHFHLWGGNWENGLSYYSREASLLFRAIYEDIRYGRKAPLEVDSKKRSNIYYSFGEYKREGRPFRPQDAILTEIGTARDSITVCMFDLSDIRGMICDETHETGVIDALIRARDRGVRVKMILNGMNTHTGALPEAWDRDFPRPLRHAVRRLRDAWIEVFSVYYGDSIYSPLHHKFAVLDGETVITGSYNWYEPSLHSDEVISIIRDARIAAAFTEEANLLLGSFRVVRE
jgi:hypothetical protein